MWEWVGGCGLVCESGCGFLGVCVYGCVCVLWGGGGGKINETVIKKLGTICTVTPEPIIFGS